MNAETIKNTRISSGRVAEIFKQFPFFNDLRDKDWNKLIKLGDSVTEDAFANIVEYGRNQVKIGNPIAETTNVKNVLAKDFKYPAVQLALSFYVINYQYVYPTDLIDYVVEHEGVFHKEVEDCIVTPDRNGAAALFSRKSSTAFRADVLEYKNMNLRKLNEFVVLNLLITWLFSEDLSTTLGETVQNGLSLSKIDDRLIKEKALSRDSHQSMSFHIDGLAVKLTKFVAKSWQDKNPLTSESFEEHLTGASSNSSTTDPDDILSILQSDEYSDIFAPLFQLTAFEVISYMGLYSDFCGYSADMKKSAETLIMLCTNQDSEWIQKRFPVAEEDDEYTDRIKGIVLSFTKKIPSAASNPSVMHLLHYVVKNSLKNPSRKVELGVLSAMHLAVFLSFPGIEDFGSSKIQSALKALDDRGDELREYHDGFYKDFYALNFSKLSVLSDWYEHCENEGWNVPFSLFFNLHYDEETALNHVFFCDDWLYLMQ